MSEKPCIYAEYVKPLCTCIDMGKSRIAKPCLALRFLLAGLAAVALGQQYPFLAIPGAPKGVRILFQDGKGRLWLGAAQQVVCFDGARFFSLADYGLPATVPSDIAEDSSGAIWIGADTGVYRFADGGVVRVRGGPAVSVVPAMPDIAIAAVLQTDRNARSRGPTSLVRIERSGGKWSSQAIMDLDSAGPLTRDRSGMILYPRPGRGWARFALRTCFTGAQARPSRSPCIRSPVSPAGL